MLSSLKDKVWEKECQKDFPAMQFGKNLWVCPSWDKKNELSTEDAIVIKMDPGSSFWNWNSPNDKSMFRIFG